MTSTSVHLADREFTASSLNERALLLRPRHNTDTELTLPRLGQWIQDLRIKGLDDVIATETELCLVAAQDPLQILAELAGLAPPSELESTERTATLPVHFDDDADWPTVEAQTGLPREDYIRRLCAAQLRVAMFGFLPGFVYLSGLPSELQCPRKAEPATHVEPRSFAVGGPYVGIYSLASPGGWQVLGRTTTSIADLGADPPIRLRIGDRLVVDPVDLAEGEDD